MEGPPPSPSVPPSILSNDLSSLSPPPSDFQSAVEFWVDLPKLSPEVLAQYKVSRETSLAYRLDEIIGEYQEGSRHWYFARYQRGIAYKFLSSELTEDLPELVEEYERRKASGVLPAFDPSAHYIHPNSRIKVMLHIKNRWGTETNASNESNFSDSDTEERETDGSGDDYGSSRGYGRRTNGRRLRSSRAGARSRMVIDTDEELEVSHRRSTRSRSTKARYTALSASMSESEYSNREPTQKKARRLKPARPAYGHVRSIEDLNAVDDGEAATLRRHRDVCEKCRQPPAHILLRGIKKRNKNKKRKRRTSPEDEFEESEEERVTSLGGWIRCLKCPVSTHWRCLAATQRQEIVKAAKAKAEKSLEQGDVHEQPHSMEIGNRLEIDQTTDFICGTCVKGGFCMYCKETVLEPDISLSSPQPPGLVQEDETGQSSAMPTKRDNDSKPRTLLFRCLTCKRLAHYHHLPNPTESTDDWNTTEKAEYYQDTTAWLCADCVSYQRPVDKIIAWRPYPPDAIEIPHLDIASLYKQPLPREYLVKWQDRSFRRTQWVPHMWLLNTHGMKLKNFLTGGTKVELVLHTTEDDAMADDASEMMSTSRATSRASSAKPGASTPNPIAPMVDAESRIPVAWKTVDRVLDVRLWHSDRRNKRFASKYGEHDEDEQTEEPHDEGERARIYDLGEEPAPDLIEDVSKYERRLGRKLRNEDANHVVWAYIKWSDLGYEDATWDSPPRPTDPDFLEFMSAFKQFVDSRDVFVQKLTGEHLRAFDNRKKEEYRTKYVLKDASDLDLGQDPKLKLMDFQVDGFNWLSNNWWTHQHCILADEMGLGKTVQIATFLGSLVQRWKAAPALVIVPNSTITNWVREVRRWAPNLRVVPFYGETKAREVIKRYELFHEKPPAGYTAAKFHVLIATYEAVLNAKDFFVFKNQPRWEVLIVDEGQRLKNDSSLLFRKLNELKSAHRIIMTGTPLNNNMRELFNLMNFLDPVEWSDLANLEKEYEELTEDLIKQLHQRLRPYFLRRVKSEVLKLPPKNEVIVPVTMTELQKQVYKSLLGNNLGILKGLTQPAESKNVKSSKGQINNLLMQLRKILQHPYLFNEDIEPRGLSAKEAHDKLIDASAKLRLLKGFLPKLKERGHRVLLFSQFSIALDILEDFLRGEGHRYLRLDGSTKNADRQKGMDEFNKPGSDIFIYLLTTRAGGVGINLFSADTVIIFDPDFNPHQDLQAIARAYRYGQQKTCLVFKLMVKESAEERIMQIGKKKLVLDHLIVQKMDDEETTSGNMESILTHGAQALFESADDSNRDINYSENDIEKLIERTEVEGDDVQEAPQGSMSFTFAKIWSADKDTMEEVEDNDQGDSWAQTLEKITEAQKKAQELEIVQSGRGARRKAAVVAQTNLRITEPVEESRVKPSTKKITSRDSDGSFYAGSQPGSDSESSGDEFALVPDPGPEERVPKRQRTGNWLGSVAQESETCAMCGQHHDDPGQCSMTESSQNLAEYREMLILHAEDEPWEQRYAAIRVIDETLYKRGDIALIVGQPLRPLRKSEPLPQPKTKQKARTG